MFEDILPERAKALLKKITPILNQKGFYLAGGSGLALQIGHRVSEDLDLFTGDTFDPDSLLLALKSKTDSSEGVVTETHTLLVILDGARCSFFFYEVPLIYEPVSFEGMIVADWRDIVAEKFKTISQRGSKKDFVDLFAVMELKKIPIEDAVSLFRKRFATTGLNFYHVLRSLTYFEDADEEPDPMMTEGHTFSWEEVKAFFINNIKTFETHFMN